MSLRPALSLGFAVILGCAKEPSSPVPAEVLAARKPAIAPRTRRSDDPRVAALRAHIDMGRLEEARSLAEDLGPAFHELPESPLLAARMSALGGQTIEAIRLVEAVRKEHPSDPDAYATAAEIYAAAGKLDLAWDEIGAGDAACGKAPELSRARGIVWISKQGGAKKGLGFLEEARSADPALPFLGRALGQAHLLLGKESAAAGKPAAALAHARQAAACDPEDVDGRRFLSETLTMTGDYEGALREIELLVARGLPLQAELALLQKKAGIGALLEKDRDRALAHFAAARQLGLSDEELSTGARILDEEAGALVRQGVDAYKAEDLEKSEANFRAALKLDADRIEAQNHLGVVLFKKGDYPGAAGCWRAVLATAEKEGLALPEAVHVNLAKALAISGDAEGARATLEGYLVHHPDGEWVSETRAALLALPAKNSGN